MTRLGDGRAFGLSTLRGRKASCCRRRSRGTVPRWLRSTTAASRFSFCLRLLDSPDDAADATQEAFREYRRKRARLLEAEIELRRAIERVAARAIPKTAGWLSAKKVASTARSYMKTLVGSSEAALLERELALGAHPAELQTARWFFDAAAADFGLDERGRYQVTTATNEAVSNAVQHGAPFPGGVIYLRASAEDGALVCSVHDGGSFELLGGAEPDLSAEQGRGFPLMRLLVDEVVLETGSEGTVVRLSKRRGTSRI